MTQSINGSCQQQPWSGVISFYPTIDTYAKLETQLDAWSQFTLADISGTPSLEILPASTFNSGVLTCHYRLNGKDGLAFGWSRHLGQTQNGPTFTSDFGSNGRGTLVVPGSGLNPADSILTFNSGYQAALYDPLCTIGDGIVHVLPGMDFRLLAGTNGLGYLREAIDNYLTSRGSSLAILEVVEGLALLRWMQESGLYPQTAVVGVSKGAWQAMLVSLLGEPDAAVCASGVSLLSRALGFEQAGGNVLPDSPYDQATIASLVNDAPTEFLFSTSDQGELPLLKEDLAVGHTASVLAGSNVSHQTHALGHTYPPNMGAWLQAVWS